MIVLYYCVKMENVIENFKIKDIALADWGRRDSIGRADARISQKNLESPSRFGVHEIAHDIQTAVLIETLIALGAEVTCHHVIFSTQDHAAAAIRRN